MKNVANTIEDLLEILAGLQGQAKMQIESSDATIMFSIARQTFRGTALTDRQYNLMQEKLQNYKEQFTALDYNFDLALENLRQPLRHIDRSKYIKLQDDEIVIRFPFRKTEISLIQEFCNNAEGYHHDKGSHIHTFAYNEINTLNLLNRFSNKEFKIDEELIEAYTAIKSIYNDPCEHLSGISDNKLINIKPSLAPYIENELGDLTNETFLHFIDRRFRYGFDYVNTADIAPISLAQKIVTRPSKSYHSKPSDESSSSILSALWELNRFPLLVVLDKNNAEEQLYEFANYYRDILQPSDQSVLFRLEDSTAGFNQLVKDRKLNNWVDNTTKVVYISKDKLPKLLVSGDWSPIAAFSYTSTMDRYVDSYIGFNCDLIVYREEIISQMRKYSRYYG